jgi:hypothetical protein
MALVIDVNAVLGFVHHVVVEDGPDTSFSGLKMEGACTCEMSEPLSKTIQCNN